MKHSRQLGLAASSVILAGAISFYFYEPKEDAPLSQPERGTEKKMAMANSTTITKSTPEIKKPQEKSQIPPPKEHPEKILTKTTTEQPSLENNMTASLDDSDMQPNSSQEAEQPHTIEAGETGSVVGVMGASLSSDDIPESLPLWDLNNTQEIDINGIPALKTQIPPTAVSQFGVGQTVAFTLPGDVGELSADIKKSTNPMAGVSVFEGTMDIAGSEGNIIISRGTIETHLVITTPVTVFTAVVDNATGETVITDQAEYVDRKLYFDDTAKLTPEELSLPAS